MKVRVRANGRTKIPSRPQPPPQLSKPSRWHLSPLALTLGLLISLFPSTQLVQLQRHPAPFSLPASVHPGEALLLPATVKAQDIYLRGQRLSPISNSSYLLGIVGLVQQPQAVVHGVIGVKHGDFFRFPIVNYFVDTVEIKHQEKKLPTALRLPAAVWARVNSEHAAQKEQKEMERERMRSILRERDGDLGSTCWQWPIRSTIVSRFASPRRLPNGETYFHSGVDLRAAEGTLVQASGDGRVVLAESMIVPGTVIVINHGEGLFTRYMHLSEVSVRPGQAVKKGEFIGRSGATGRVEAPHLHWEVVWKGNSANPQEFLKAWEHICGQG